MAYDPNLVDALEELATTDWQGEVHRYTSTSHPPDRENTLGARWNPLDVPAIYTALEIETAYAEFWYAISRWDPQPDPRKFTMHRIRVSISKIVDLRSSGLLDRLGVHVATIESDDHRRCQAVGGAAHWLSIGGLLVPSARHPNGSNLVIFTDQQPSDYMFEPLDSHQIDPQSQF